MNIKIHLEYNGSSKILKRICQTINYLSENASGDMLKATYDTNDSGVVDNAEKVNGHNVDKDVPADAVFTDTIYDPTLMESRVESNQNNIQILIDELMNFTTYYIVDSDGKILIDSNGFPLISVTYYSKLDELQKSINELLARKYVYSDGTYDDPNG